MYSMTLASTKLFSFDVSCVVRVVYSCPITIGDIYVYFKNGTFHVFGDGFLQKDSRNMYATASHTPPPPRQRPCRGPVVAAGGRD